MKTKQEPLKVRKLKKQLIMISAELSYIKGLKTGLEERMENAEIEYRKLKYESELRIAKYDNVNKSMYEETMWLRSLIEKITVPATPINCKCEKC